MEKLLIPYYRVSTERQGRSQLGLDGQKTAVQSYARANGCRLLGNYVEVETGKSVDRPQLKAALLHAKRAGGTLCVAKLDRLARNVAFLSALMDSGVPFVACDNAHANRLTLHILAAVAEAEVKAISERTKVALQAAKKRGQLLGSARPGHWQGREQARLKGARKGNRVSAVVRAELAEKAHDELRPIFEALRVENITLDEMAERLNAEGWRTRRGQPWTKVSVCRFLAKCRDSYRQ
jgi:DNA invertase Pin-like site-specific DNA recombinase